MFRKSPAKPLRRHVVGLYCHTGAQCGAFPTWKGHRRAPPPSTSPFLCGSNSCWWLPVEGRGGRAATAKRSCPAASSRWNRPAAAQVQPHLCQPAQQPKAHAPGGRWWIMPRRPTEGFLGPEELPPQPSCQAVQTAPAMTKTSDTSASQGSNLSPPASGMKGEGGGSLVTLGRCGGMGVLGCCCFYFRYGAC